METPRVSNKKLNICTQKIISSLKKNVDMPDLPADGKAQLLACIPRNSERKPKEFMWLLFETQDKLHKWSQSFKSVASKASVGKAVSFDKIYLRNNFIFSFGCMWFKKEAR
jgi:hypothetical protein